MFSGSVRVFYPVLPIFPKTIFLRFQSAKCGGISTIAVDCYIAIAWNEHPSKNYPFTEHWRVCYIAAVGLLSGFEITEAFGFGC